MARDYTPPYLVEMEGTTKCAWNVRERPGASADGKPTAENLKKYVEAFIASQEPGKPNAHIPKAFGHKIVPTWARIVRNGSREVVATYGL